MVKLDLPCYVFDENELEEFQNVLERTYEFEKPDSDKVLPKFNLPCYQDSSSIKECCLQLELVNYDESEMMVLLCCQMHWICLKDTLTL